MKRHHSHSKKLMSVIRKEAYLIVLGVIVIGAGYWSIRRAPSPPAHPISASPTVPPFYESVSAAEPLPHTLSPALFQAEPRVASAYKVAEKKPALLAQQPCYCGCDKIGHHSLLDCYAARHAETCDICIDEALRADEMDRAGKTAAEIRARIIREAQGSGE